MISILIANYNSKPFFTDCYNSLLQQTYNNWECIIVDDASTDGSADFIKELIANDDRFSIYINDSNKGVGFTKNSCIKYAKYSYCAFLDPDDALVPHALHSMVKILNNQPYITLLYSNFYFCNSDLKPFEIHKNKQVDLGISNFFNLEFVISHFAVFQKSKIVEMGGIDCHLKRAVDQDMYLKLYDAPSSKLLHVDEVLYLYRMHDKGISTYENQDVAYFWHWCVILNSAKRRNINVEYEFYKVFQRVGKERKEVESYYLNLLRSSIWIKLGIKLKLFTSDLFFKRLDKNKL